MRVLVTGSAGFLGGHIVERLKQDPTIEVVGVDNFEPTCGGRENQYTDYSVDVSNVTEVSEFVKDAKITHIVHAAALGRNLNCQFFPLRAWQVNVMGTVNVLEAARIHGVKRVVCVSSNICLCPDVTTYKATKLSLEHAVEAYQRYGLSCQAVRPCNIAGSGQSRTEYQPCAFAGLDSYFEKNGKVQITGTGEQTRDFIDAKDVARGIYLALISDYQGPAFDLATGKLTSMNEIAHLLDVPIEYIPARPGDAMTIISDPSVAERVIGFKAEIGLEEMLNSSFPSVMAARTTA
jgi:UDP-glucose 4-epimerase